MDLGIAKRVRMMIAAILKHRKILRCFLILLAILHLSLLVLYTAGCTSEQKYKVLSFFFDGVPPPGSKEAKDGLDEDSGEGSHYTGPERKGSVHKPFGTNKCTVCHEPDQITDLRISRDKLCWSCHSDLLKDTAKLHGPAVSGQCLVCHDAHQSERKSLLKLDARDLCLYCHEADIRHGKEDQFMNCTFCHSPHGSREAFYLRPEEIVEETEEGAEVDEAQLSDEEDTSIDNLKQVDE